MSATLTRILSLLELRYDFHSARSVLHNWCRSKDIRELPDFYSNEDIVSLIAFLEARATHSEKCTQALARCLDNDEGPGVTEKAVAEEVVLVEPKVDLSTETGSENHEENPSDNDAEESAEDHQSAADGESHENAELKKKKKKKK